MWRRRKASKLYCNCDNFGLKMSTSQVSNTETSPVYFLDETVGNAFHAVNALTANRELGRMTVRKYISLNLIYRLWKFKAEAITADNIICKFCLIFLH
jgi:hypothetical protein